MRVGINGMGRIGRLAFRAALGGVFREASDPRGMNRLDIVHVNELKGGAAATAHLLEFDSIHGRWREQLLAKAMRLSSSGISASVSAHRPLRQTYLGVTWVAMLFWSVLVSS
ncbi:glyceraldehyde 3-phosphate dehydrogenase NAD-binding domain-containing protein [Paeniroseomonas aquatica]|uniref:glyceraldehyde 3-phosphate dehydrogenase NAD-binding domain-containing protein n=1 Tax=Paeniroseomonas aquatica TaxID=373043 RepID=UPI00361A58C3